MKRLLNLLKKKKELYININYSNNQFYLKGKNILVTGGTSGIGYDIAKRALNLGANVIITGRNEEILSKVEKELGCRTIKWDISNVEKASEMAKKVISMFNGNIDCVVNNAGIYDNNSCINTTEEIFNSIIDVNLKGTYFVTKEFINQAFLKQKNGGNIIFISSNRGIFGDDCVYGVSKAGIINFTKGLAKKYLKYNIRVNSVAPGMTTSGINGIKDSDNLYSSSLKGNRVLSSKEIAEVIMFLISDSSRCITGQVIACDNGESIL